LVFAGTILIIVMITEYLLYIRGREVLGMPVTEKMFSSTCIYRVISKKMILWKDCYVVFLEEVSLSRKARRAINEGEVTSFNASRTMRAFILVQPPPQNTWFQVIRNLDKSFQYKTLRVTLKPITRVVEG
jgi:hypothetical protein